MDYREAPPPPALADHVACVWTRTGAPPRIVPDGCVDVVWTGERVIVAGPATRAMAAGTLPDGVKHGVRFRVGNAAALGLPAIELLDRSLWVGEVCSDGEAIEERVAEAPERLVAVIGERLRAAPPPDRLVRAAVHALAAPRPLVGDLSRTLAISERQLRRRFERAVGYPPRTLARILRFQRFLAVAARDGDLAPAAYAAGYADQPHLTRDCVELAGVTPAALVAEGLGPAGERLDPPRD